MSRFSFQCSQLAKAIYQLGILFGENTHKRTGKTATRAHAKRRAHLRADLSNRMSSGYICQVPHVCVAHESEKRDREYIFSRLPTFFFPVFRTRLKIPEQHHSRKKKEKKRASPSHAGHCLIAHAAGYVERVKLERLLYTASN